MHRNILPVILIITIILIGVAGYAIRDQYEASARPVVQNQHEASAFEISLLHVGDFVEVSGRLRMVDRGAIFSGGGSITLRFQDGEVLPELLMTLAQARPRIIRIEDTDWPETAKRFFINYLPL